MGKNVFKMKEFSEKYGFTTEKHCCYGLYKGYHVHIKQVPFGNPSCLITIVMHAKEHEGALRKFLEKNKKSLNITAFGVVGIGAMIQPHLVGGSFRSIENILDKTVSYLSRNGIEDASCCPYCGQPLEEDVVDMIDSGIGFQAHRNCYSAAHEAELLKKQKEDEKPANKALGVCGTLCGVLVGSIVFIALYFLMEFAAVGAAVSALLGSWLYGKFGGKNILFRPIINFSISMVATLGAFAICLLIQSNWSFTAIGERLMNDAGYRLAFIVNLTCSVVFIASATLYSVISCIREQKKSGINVYLAKK